MQQPLSCCPNTIRRFRTNIARNLRQRHHNTSLIIARQHRSAHTPSLISQANPSTRAHTIIIPKPPQTVLVITKLPLSQYTGVRVMYAPSLALLTKILFSFDVGGSSP
jgi:hypothetical protein